METLCDSLAAAENDLVTTPGAKPHTVTIDGASFVLAAGPEADAVLAARRVGALLPPFNPVVADLVGAGMADWSRF